MHPTSNLEEWRWIVKAECLRLLVTLRLDPAKTRLVLKFVNTCLRLDGREERVFQAEVDKMELVD